MIFSTPQSSDLRLISSLFLAINDTKNISTLLKLLARQEMPTNGEIIYGPKIISNYFAQHQLESLDINKTNNYLTPRALDNKIDL